MELKGSRQIAADRDTVWAALNDPAILRDCIPGCQEMTGSAEEGFEAVVKQKVGPVSATFRGRVTLSNVVPGSSYTISGEGKGGAAGFAKGGADVRLADEAGGTRLDYDVQASVGGKLAQLGGRVIDGFAKKMADQFFDNFKQAVEGPGDGSAGSGGAAAEAAPAGGEAMSPGATAATAHGMDAGVPAAAPAGAEAETRPAGAGAKAGGPAAPPRQEAPGLWARITAWLRGLFGGRG
jgi:carbon monoxide dehydrogenase subunit G